MSPEQQRIIEQSEWFKNRSPYLKSFLLTQGKTLSLNAQQSLFLRGDQHDGLYAVLSGVVRVSGVSSEGKEAVLSFIDSSLWFGELTLFDGGLRTHDVHAQTNVTLFFVPQRCLGQLLNEQPKYWQDFGLLLAQKLRVMFSSMEDQALLTAEQKVCKRLLMLSEHSDVNKALVLSQQQLADMSYLTRQTINQILQHLVSLKAISLGYQRITILDKQKLKVLASQT